MSLQIFWPGKLQYCWRSCQERGGEVRPVPETPSLWRSSRCQWPHRWRANLPQSHREVNCQTWAWNGNDDFTVALQDRNTKLLRFFSEIQLLSCQGTLEQGTEPPEAHIGPCMGCMWDRSQNLPFFPWMRSSTRTLATSWNSSIWDVETPKTFWKEYCVWEENKYVKTPPSWNTDMSNLGHVRFSRYLSELPIPGCFEAFGGVQLDGGATDHLDAAFSVFYTQRSHTAVYLGTDLKTWHLFSPESPYYRTAALPLSWF